MAASDFELQPTLTGELLRLRPLRRDDFEELFRAASDPLIWEQHPENDRYKRDVFRRYFDSGMESGGAFAIVDLATGRIIGSSRYWNFDRDANEIEIGWTFLECAFWGGRYNRELKQLMLDHAFRFVERVVFVIGENNLRSQKATAKIGATFARKVQRPSSSGPQKWNVVLALDRRAYEAARARSTSC
jgi:N-acetyltransferase